MFSSLSCVTAASECALSFQSLPCVAAGSKCALSSLSDVTAMGGCASTSVSLLDAWAGVSSFSEAWELQTHCRVADHAWIEWDPTAISVLEQFYPWAQGCRDFYNYQWKPWVFKWPLVVTGGPSCCPFSISGKRKRRLDPRSSQCMDTALLACQLGALVLIMENVSDFLSGDDVHGLFTDVCQYLRSEFRSLAGVWEFRDSEVGGLSSRLRVFPVWETDVMASSLPPLCTTLPERQGALGTVAEALEAGSEVQELAL